MLVRPRARFKIITYNTDPSVRQIDISFVLGVIFSAAMFCDGLVKSLCSVTLQLRVQGLQHLSGDVWDLGFSEVLISTEVGFEALVTVRITQCDETFTAEASHAAASKVPLLIDNISIKGRDKLQNVGSTKFILPRLVLYSYR